MVGDTWAYATSPTRPHPAAVAPSVTTTWRGRSGRRSVHQASMSQAPAMTAATEAEHANARTDPIARALTRRRLGFRRAASARARSAQDSRKSVSYTFRRVAYVTATGLMLTMPAVTRPATRLRQIGRA